MLDGRMLTGLGTGAAGVAFLLALALVVQRRLVYFPLIQDVPPVTGVLPNAHEVAFETEDRLSLHGWFVPAEPPAPGTTVLVFNGNAGDRSFRASLAFALARAGLSVLLFDYRGFGGNPGSPSEAGLSADARAAQAYLASRDDVDPRRFVYFGESLGAAVAVRLAVERPPAALVLRSPFTSLADVGRLHYRFLPIDLFLLDRFDAIGRIGSVRCPVLVIAGERDRTVPPAQSRRLYEAAPGQKRFVLIPGADHNDRELLDGPRLIEEVVRFLRDTSVLERGAGSPVREG
jgi:fermentation-respiration switch protein FrsA (DUF1100 family)